MNPDAKLRNIGPKSAAWLRQVGLHTPEALAEAGTVGAFMRIKRAGFRPSLNLLYALEGAILGNVAPVAVEDRRQQLVADAEAAIAELPPPRNRPPAGPVRTTQGGRGDDD